VTARVGDLVLVQHVLRRGGEMAVGQVARQTDVMSEVVTEVGILMVKTYRLLVVQPGHEEEHTHRATGARK
jgi:hypothetical protein